VIKTVTEKVDRIGLRMAIAHIAAAYKDTDYYSGSFSPSQSNAMPANAAAKVI
jgi:hypothetical protein